MTDRAGHRAVGGMGRIAGRPIRQADERRLGPVIATHLQTPHVLVAQPRRHTLHQLHKILPGAARLRQERAALRHMGRRLRDIEPQRQHRGHQWRAGQPLLAQRQQVRGRRTRFGKTDVETRRCQRLPPERLMLEHQRERARGQLPGGQPSRELGEQTAQTEEQHIHVMRERWQRQHRLEMGRGAIPGGGLRRLAIGPGKRSGQFRTAAAPHARRRQRAQFAQRHTADLREPVEPRLRLGQQGDRAGIEGLRQRHRRRWCRWQPRRPTRSTGTREQRRRAGRGGKAQRRPVPERLGTLKHLRRQRCQTAKQAQARCHVDQHALWRGDRNVGAEAQQGQRQRLERDRLGRFVAIVESRLRQ